REPGSAAAPSAPKSDALEPTRENYLKLATDVEAALHKNVLEAWFPRCVDNEHGGVYANYCRDLAPMKNEGKVSVFQGRMTWITAEVALRRPALADQFLPYTKHGLKFLNDTMWDNQSGGTFWGLSDSGRIDPAFGGDKQLYGIGFLMYAAANSYR